MNIRTIREHDIKNCAEVFVEVFSGEPWNEPWEIDCARNRLEHFYHSKGFIGVMIESNGVIGFALGNWEPFHFGKMFYLREMCISPNLQTKGIGGKVYEALEEELKSLSVVSVYLTTDREIPAASFYVSHGFKYNEKMGFYAKDINS